MIYSDPFDVLEEAGFTPENFYIHPAYYSPANYAPVWHIIHARSKPKPRSESEYKVTEVLY